MYATGHHRSTANHAHAPAATPIAAPFIAGWTGTVRRSAMNDNRGPIATSSDNDRQRSPMRPGHLTSPPPTTRLEATFHANRPSGINTAPHSSQPRGRPSIDRPRPSASHSAAAAIASAPPAVATTCQSDRARYAWGVISPPSLTNSPCDISAAKITNAALPDAAAIMLINLLRRVTDARLGDRAGAAPAET